MLFTFPSRYWFAIGLPGVFSLAGWSRRIRAELLVLRVTQDTTKYHRLWLNFPDHSSHCLHTMAWSYNPVYALPHMRFGLFPVRSPLLGESLNCFLFLQVLRCFSSLRLPPYYSMDNYPSGNWVVPFGNPRIKGHLHLPEAYRSLSRPSSPPRAKASTRRPNLLSPFIAHTFSCNQLLRFSFT